MRRTTGLSSEVKSASSSSVSGYDKTTSGCNNDVINVIMHQKDEGGSFCLC